MQGSVICDLFSLPPGNTHVPLCRPIQESAVHQLSVAAVSAGLGEGAESGADPYWTIAQNFMWERGGSPIKTNCDGG